MPDKKKAAVRQRFHLSRTETVGEASAHALPDIRQGMSRDVLIAAKRQGG